ncbi:MAG: maltose alpha-D-glucosyltransferase [Elusimicrobia bacterium]|nr:maltose alpha-D-glucosyltransferase [Elusimicrobiota bacterium]
MPVTKAPHWYKDAVIYEVRVRSFYDSKGDGVGDLRGLTEKLGYLQDLGVTGLWLLPFYPSPMKDDGYDIADYCDIHPDYGTLQDFRAFLRQAHRRGLKVITELVLNHTSDQHAWFQRARRDKPGGAWRDYYVWSDTPDKYADSRVIFQDFENSNWTWDSVARAYYWHRFYSHQPDLNFDNPAVRKSMMRVVDFWFKLGVDGLRLDAVPYLYEREGTNCENLPETHAFLQHLRSHVDKSYSHRMLLAEANQWPEDAAAYFGQGNECHMAFHFPIMPRLYLSMHMEDRFPIYDTLTQTPAIDPACQWAIFLRNHDELSLEMVTDEERQYMYRVYAPDPRARLNLGIRRRLAPLLGNNRRKIELMNGLLLSLPGTPVLYYGDELGMGDNIFLGDRNGVRTPMQWSSDRNAGFSRANPQRLPLPIIVDPEYHYETINVEAQQNNPHSLLWWTKRLVAQRKQFKAFGRGTLEFLLPPNPKILAFIRQFDGETVLVVANLSRFAQYVDLDLSRFKGCSVIETFGHTEFPPATERPYPLTLGPHAFYWFALEPSRDPAVLTASGITALPEVSVLEDWTKVLEGTERGWLEDALSRMIVTRRWFGGKARRIKRLTVVEEIPVREGDIQVILLMLRVEYSGGGEETYALPIQFALDPTDATAASVPAHSLARLRVTRGEQTVSGFLVDAFGDHRFLRFLPGWIARHRRTRGLVGWLVGAPVNGLQERLVPDGSLEPRAVPGEQSNTSVFYGDRLVLKAYRRLEAGINPEYEVGRFLAGRFAHTPTLLAAVEYRPPREEPVTLALMHEFVANHGTAWTYTLDELQRYLEATLAHPEEPASADPQSWAQELMAPYLSLVRLLGQRTAELHLAMSSEGSDPVFAPEPFSHHYQQSISQAMRSYAARILSLLRTQLPSLTPESRAAAEQVLKEETRIARIFRALAGQRLTGARLRIHGDYHLGQVLFTGKDFVIIDFEGEPSRPISERRIKRSPLRDVAGMLRSFHYASRTALSSRTSGPVARPEDLPRVERWAETWHRRVASTFLEAYLASARSGSFLPQTDPEIQRLLKAFLFEKACYELGYELDSRPDWVSIPLQGILRMLRQEPA